MWSHQSSENTFPEQFVRSSLSPVQLFDQSGPGQSGDKDTGRCTIHATNKKSLNMSWARVFFFFFLKAASEINSK